MKKIIDDLVNRLTSDFRIEYEERAGIIEYDGVVKREEAEAYALLCILHRHPMASSGVTLLRAELENKTEYVLTTNPEEAYRHLSTAGWTVSEVEDLSAVLDEVCGGMATLEPFSASYLNMKNSTTQGESHE